MTPIATIYIPFSDAHKSVVENAFRSATSQTVKCDVVMEASPNTPALLRNRAVNAKSPFICFLDADDTIEPTFVEDCLRTYKQGSYVYTAWYEGDAIMTPRECNPFLSHDFHDGRGLVGGYHLVTTLFPTVYFGALGSFNENLPGMEDTDFYMRANAKNVCGILCPKPLLHYNGGGDTRSKAFKSHPEYEAIRRLIYERNGGIEAMAGCCGVFGGAANANLDGQQPGDIAVQTLYAPMTQVGRATGRFYTRPFFQGQTIMVDPRDAAAMPDLFKPIATLREIAPDPEVSLKAAGLLD